MKKNTGLLKISMIIGIGALAVLLCIGCSNGLEPGGGERSQVQVIIDGTAARTVVPVDPGFNYTLRFTASGKEPVVQGIAGTAGTAYLDPGTWTLEVSGEKAGDRVAESDGIPVSVSGNGETITVPVTMHPALGGVNGTFHYAINLDAVPGASATITLSPQSGGPSPSPILLTGTRDGNVSLAPGYYRLQVAAERGELSAYRQELVHIYSHTTTGKEYRFIESNFTDHDQLGELVWYVSDIGSDSNNGLSSGAALATVGKALELIRDAYSGGSVWPVEGDTTTPKTASIVISGTVTADTGTSNGMVEISGTNAYPPVELRGPAGGTGTLDATGKDKRVLYIRDGNRVT